MILNLAYPEVRVGVRKNNVPALLDRLERADDPAETQYSERAVIAFALGYLHAQQAISLLSELIRPGVRVDVRDCAADALRRIGGDEAAAVLRPALDDDRYWIRASAVKTVPAADPEVAAKLAQIAKDDQEQVIRAYAIDALAETRDDTWIPLMTSAGRSDRLVVAFSSANALDTINTPAARQALNDIRATRRSIATALTMLDAAAFAKRQIRKITALGRDKT